MFGLNRIVKRFKRFLIGWSVTAVVNAVLRLNSRQAAGFAHFIGRVLYRLDRTDRKRIDHNLARVFGQAMSPVDRNALAKVVCINLCRHLVEAIHLLKLTPDDVRQKVDDGGFEAHVRRAFDEGRSVMIITAHYGNWELLAARVAQMGPLTVLARRNENPTIESLICRLRSAHQIRILDRSDPGTPREMIRMGREGGHIIGILMDQDTSRIQGIFSDFMGIPALTPSGPASVAVRNLFSIFIGVLKPQDDGFHTIRLSGPVQLPENGSRDEQIQAATDLFNKRLGDIILNEPEFWVWNHRRWRRKPSEMDGQ